MADRVVAHADRTSEAFLVELRERFPRFVAKARHRPVDQVQIDVVAGQSAASPFERWKCGLVSVVTIPELRCDENLVPRNSALPDCRADVPFVRVHFRGVDQAVSALQVGYRLIDTAKMYANERDVGAAVRQSGIPRDEIFVTTKLWNSDHGYESALRAFERSRRELALDYIDLYLIHWPVPGLRDESWKAFAKLHEEGLARSIGVSNYTIRHLEA